ncbi:hypothetical protein [Clostridium chrysemydis]|uniref:hypothetical protein n=1 Tax=Clostridium chrysemydis TaxID=2665504 RepID=UPI0018839A5F|nr:hypothetical protein [Clostridium chrysemydis]
MVKGLYIRNIEAVDALKFERGEREYIKAEWTGFIPHSLELLKLKQEKIEVLINKSLVRLNNKHLNSNDGELLKSRDLINVNFNCGYKYTFKKEIEEKIKYYKGKIKDEKLQIKTAEKYKNIIDELTTKLNSENVNIEEKESYKLTVDALREKIYREGFSDENGIKFVLYKRSGSKSRQGKVIFIREDLAREMLEWSRMYIDFKQEEEIDIVGLGAYSSLVSSSIEDTVIIKPNSILIVDDIESSWIQRSKFIYKDSNTNRLSVREEADGLLASTPTDGSCLLDKSYFERGIDFKLLRNHMFKSCAFRCDVQLFYKDYCKKEGIDYNSFKVKDMFGNKMLAKNVKVICTPSSLKALKFANFVYGETEKDMFEYWKDIVKKDKNVFGVCKHNKSSKHKFNDVEYNQMSYQMINSLPFTENELKKVCEFEINYVSSLKKDINVFKEYLIRNANNLNCNEAVVAVLNTSKDFEQTSFFREFRTQTIGKYVEKLKSGKIKNIGDYCTMIANPISYLKQSLGIYDHNSTELEGNEIYTKLFAFNKELVCFRNPHTSQANVYIARNKYNEDIEKYFGFGKNIVVVNAINNAICQILSGADFDSDNCLIYENETLVDVGKRCYSESLVCENKVLQDKVKYKLNLTNLAKVDNKLSESKRIIGRVVNLGQLAMSKFWDEKINNKDTTRLQEIIDICTILSGMAIDNAKKTYDIDIKREIDCITKELNIDKKPLFWKYVSSDKKLRSGEYRKDNLKEFKTSMDMLNNILTQSIKREENNKECLKITDVIFLEEFTKNNVNRKRKSKILEQIVELDNEIKHTLDNTTESEKEKKLNMLNVKVDKNLSKLKRANITKDTMYSILLELDSKKSSNYTKCKKRLFNILYQYNREQFLGLFK